MNPFMDSLMQTAEPALRYKLLVNVQKYSPEAPEAQQLRSQIPTSPVVWGLLSERDERGMLPYPAYKKWVGSHWVLAELADLNYPPGDESLIPMREQELEWLLPRQGDPQPLRKKKVLEGRTRTCASMEGNALYALLALGLADERVDVLAQRLMDWQWPDGGWNCDKNPSASHSSFHETIIPLRGLALYARLTGNAAARAASERAAEVFLTRGLLRRLSDGEIIHPQFTRLYYPAYWHYNILFGLTVMAEGGWIGDERCREALNLLESKRLPDGGFRAEGMHYKVVPAVRAKEVISGTSRVSWGGVSIVRANPWVTVEAVSVLAAAGRF